MTFVARGSVAADNFRSHREGHDAALDLALEDLASQVPDKPVSFDLCEIAFFATVTVTNPGVVDEYIAIVTTP